ncbi:MAG: hypothetical protein AB1512_02895 [Thermodesulfobacteriota bacterium]
MGRYRGRLEGKLRGKYTHKTLRAKFDDAFYRTHWDLNSFYSSPQDDIDAYLIRAGKRIHECAHDLIPWRDFPHQKPKVRTMMYHIAGSTIKVEFYLGPESTLMPQKEIEATLKLEIHSNAETVDIVDKLLKRFPFLTEDLTDGKD